MMKKILAIIFTLVFAHTLLAQKGIIDSTRTTITSPDRNILCTVYQKIDEKGKKAIFYTVSYKGKAVILESELDIQLDNHLSELAMALKVDKTEKWCEDLQFVGIKTSQKDTTWKPLYGERSLIRDHYQAVNLAFKKASNADYTLEIQVRAYDAGVAIRYYFPENPKGSYYQITAENTEFALPSGTTAFYTQWAQGKYAELPLENWVDAGERPMPLRLSNGLWACLAEAQMVDYARAKFIISKTKKNTIQTALYGGVDGITYFGTPWRVIMIAESEGKLIENNDIILNLNTPNKIANTDWIKPGKIIREMTLTTEGAKAAIDFAVKRNLQYVLFDWKWYGPALTWDTDATQVKAKMDMAEIVAYGKERGVGIWLYVNLQSLYKQADEIFPLYKKWGIKGVKFGFVQAGSHRWTTWVEEAIKKCADNQLMVNVHDDWRPTGEMRTYPNLMTAEGVRGNEEMPDATHNVTLPFTRYIGGAADYTICYFDKRIKTTHAHQLAMAAVYYSPLQTLFWYDQPKASNDEPELEFWNKIPTTWDETRVIQGEISKYITTARRNGKDWFVGTLTSNEGRTLKIKLDFLPKGIKYTANIYADDSTLTSTTKVGIQRITVDSATVLDAKLLPSGGQAIWLTPLK